MAPNRTAALAAALSLVAACGDDRDTAPRPDAGPRADGGPADGGDTTRDAGPIDGGMIDAGPSPDAGVFDALEPGNDPWFPADPEICDIVAAPPTCSVAADCDGQNVAGLDCTEGLCLCVDGGCEGQGYCARRAAACSSDDSCGGPTTDSSCVTAPGGDRYCRAPIGAACRGRWDCPEGFECEPLDPDAATSDGRVCASGDEMCDCVDRRLPCRYLDEERERGGICPVGYVCSEGGGAGRPWCQRALTCTDAGDCPEDGVCFNPTGGTLQGFCAPGGGECATDADCAEAPEGARCTVSIHTGATVCGWDPPCDPSEPACSPSFSCNETLHTLATAFCHPTFVEDGFPQVNCQSDAECRDGSRCIWLDLNPPLDPADLEVEPLPYGECTCFNPALGPAGGSQPCEGRPASP